jgi:hypothetical protein
MSLKAHPLVDDFVIILVGEISDEFFALAYTAVSIDLCVSFLVDYGVDDCSHFDFLFSFI